MWRFWNWFARRAGHDGPPRIYVFGDSHTAALLQASQLEDRAALYDGIKVIRIRKDKGGKEIGDESLDRFCDRISRLGPHDYVFSAVGGNQYAFVSTIRHERDFVVLDNSEVREQDSSGRFELVPYRALQSFIEGGVRNSDGPILERMRAATSAKMFHLSPPPPKLDNGYIRQHHETLFAEAGLGVLEPTDPAFRLLCWKMQQDCLSDLCVDTNMQLLPPPSLGVTSEGFLARPCYGGDVTHANRRYGELVLQQILDTVADLENQRAQAA